MLPFSVSSGPPVLGEILHWSCAGVTVRYHEVVAALRGAELTEGGAGPLAPRHAYRRASQALAAAGLLHTVREDAQELLFQFAAPGSTAACGGAEAATLLILDKATGTVTGPAAEPVARAQAAWDRCLATHGAAVLTRLVRQLFAGPADLFPLAAAGGAYFCPREHGAVIDRVHTFLRTLHGRLARFPVAAGTVVGNRESSAWSRPVWRRPSPRTNGPLPA